MLPNTYTVDFHAIADGIDAGPELGDDGAVYGDAAPTDEELGLTTARDAGGGEELLETDTGGWQ